MKHTICIAAALALMCGAAFAQELSKPECRKKRGGGSCWDSGKEAKPWEGLNKGVKWESSLDEAKKRAAREGKPIMLYQLVGDLDKEGCWAAGDLLRTVTFSDKKVAELVNANFVSAWYNRGVGFHNEDYSTEQWIFTSAMEAYTTKNICTFFLTPEGKVFHYVCGYYSPDVFLTYLNVALQVRSAAFDEKMQLKASGLEALHNVHGEVVKIIGTTEKKIGELLQDRKEGWKKVLADYDMYSYRDVKHKHTAACANNLHEGYRYLTRLHKYWSEVKELPDLKDVQYNYLWGNPFTEEGPGSKQIGNDGGGPNVMRGCCCEK